MGPQHPKSKRVLHSAKALSKAKRMSYGALAAQTISSLPVHIFHELRSIGEAVTSARHTAATACLTLPNARQPANDREMAEKLYASTVRFLAEQVKRLPALPGEKQP